MVIRTETTCRNSPRSGPEKEGIPQSPGTSVPTEIHSSANQKTPEAARRTFVVRLSASKVNCPMATCRRSTQYALRSEATTAQDHQNSAESNSKSNIQLPTIETGRIIP